MEVSFVSLLNCNQFGWWVEEEEQDPPPPTHPTPKWSSRVGKMSNEEEEEDDPHPLPTPPSQWAVKSSAFLLSFLTVSCEEFYILAWSLFTLGRWAGVVKHYTAVPAYWDPRGSACSIITVDSKSAVLKMG